MNRLVRGALTVLAVTTAVAGAATAQSPEDPARLALIPGDRLLIKVWLDTTFADTVRIDASGAAVLPRIGPLVVTGLPSFSIADSVRLLHEVGAWSSPPLEIRVWRVMRSVDPDRRGDPPTSRTLLYRRTRASNTGSP